MSEIGLDPTPVGSQEIRNMISGVNVTTSPVHVGNSNFEETVPEEFAMITIGVFFDGTLNSRNNTQARLAYESAGNGNSSSAAKTYEDMVQNTEPDSRGSYENDLSNVARMEPTYPENTDPLRFQTKLYIEGIGTTDNEADDETGMGFGQGPTGVPKKVEKACKEIAKIIERQLERSDAEKVKTLTIDTFGFSRGAAAARHFIFQLHKNIYKYTYGTYPGSRRSELITSRGDLGLALKELGLEEPTLVEVRFAGLYETVASFGKVHFNDTSDLGLNLVKRAKNSFQLVAQDEHRENFAITNMKSAGSRGVEKLIPGVHSDIGGGYTNNAKEDNLVLYQGTGNLLVDMDMSSKIRNHLIREKWYRDDEITIHPTQGYRITVNRIVDSNRYSFIPLHIMVEYANTKGLSFEYDKINNSYPLDESTNLVIEGTDRITYTTTLQEIKNRLDRYIYGDAPPLEFSNNVDKNMLHVIRKRYVHTSAHYSNKILLGLYAPHHPDQNYITRRREENNG